MREDVIGCLAHGTGQCSPSVGTLEPPGRASPSSTWGHPRETGSGVWACGADCMLGLQYYLTELHRCLHPWLYCAQKLGSTGRV